MPKNCSAAFAYWIWPTKSYRSLARKLAAGSFATIRAAYFTLFASFLCAIFGEFYSSLPHLTKMEILLGPVGVFLGALGGTAIFGIFFAMAFILISVVARCLIVLVGQPTDHELLEGVDAPNGVVGIQLVVNGRRIAGDRSDDALRARRRRGWSFGA